MGTLVFLPNYNGTAFIVFPLGKMLTFGKDILSHQGRIHLFLCMIRPPKMAVLLLSVHPLLDQCLLPLHPTHMPDLPAYLLQIPASDCSYQRGSEGRSPLLVSLVTSEPT